MQQITPSKINPEQLAKVQEFKSQIVSEYRGLYHQFETTEEFRTKARIHLIAIARQTVNGYRTRYYCIGRKGEMIIADRNVTASSFKSTGL